MNLANLEPRPPRDPAWIVESVEEDAGNIRVKASRTLREHCDPETGAVMFSEGTTAEVLLTADALRSIAELMPR